MLPLDKKIQDAWVGHIAGHSGGRNNDPLSRDVAKAVFKGNENAPAANGGGDFARLKQYINQVEPDQFKHDVTYQLYYVTECLIWLWKRLPRAILLRAENGDDVDKAIAALLRDLNAGTPIKDLPIAERAEISVAKQGRKLTPAEGVEPVVKATEMDPAGLREAILTAQSHEPPPPPPGWPPLA